MDSPPLSLPFPIVAPGRMTHRRIPSHRQDMGPSLQASIGVPVNEFVNTPAKTERPFQILQIFPDRRAQPKDISDLVKVGKSKDFSGPTFKEGVENPLRT